MIRTEMAKKPIGLERELVQKSVRSSEGDCPRILIVEDEPDYAFRLMKWFEDWQIPNFAGYCKIYIAQNIQEAEDYLRKDVIDIFILDLIVNEAEGSLASEAIGKAFVYKVIESTNAGIIVYSSLAATSEAAPLITAGADDYIQKHSDIETMRSRIHALWRRIQLIRPKKKNAFGHTNRVFLIGDWRFTVGNRTLTNSVGEYVRLSSTEHAFLSHICAIESHECTVEEFNLTVLGRRPFERSMRVDNLIYRLRKKLGNQLQLISEGGAYHLIDVKELRRQARMPISRA